MAGSRAFSTFGRLVGEYTWNFGLAAVPGLLVAFLSVLVQSPDVVVAGSIQPFPNGSLTILKESGFPFPWFRELWQTECSQFDCNTVVRPSIDLPFLVYDMLFYIGIAYFAILVYRKIRH